MVCGWNPTIGPSVILLTNSNVYVCGYRGCKENYKPLDSNVWGGYGGCKENSRSLLNEFRREKIQANQA